MRIRRKHVIGALAILATIFLIIPAVAIEALYRFELSRISGRPHAERTLTADQEREVAECFHVGELQPVYPWLTMWHVAQSFVPALRRKGNGRAALADQAARHFIVATGQAPNKLDWHLWSWVLSNWVSRNMTRGEAISSLGDQPFSDMRIGFLSEMHDCAMARKRKMPSLLGDPASAREPTPEK